MDSQKLVSLAGCGTSMTASAQRPTGPPTPGACLATLRRTRKVTKPWGEERWLVEDDAPFGFKLIRIRAGCRTSLQYHERKEEAAIVLSGEAALHVAPGETSDLTELRLRDGDVMHLRPMMRHRIYAISDVELVEVSTPHLDDVIRIADDYARPDGRIAAEHQSESA
jgi:mannose-6-phosphate isomerase